MIELQVIDIICQELRRKGLLPSVLHGSDPLMVALRRAAARIVSECNSDNRRAARAASQVGFAVTRGRTRI